MPAKKEKKERGMLRAILQYIFLWPTLRTYIQLWFKYKPTKVRNKKKKEKVFIIEDV
jgi:hypothetical protein